MSYPKYIFQYIKNQNSINFEGYLLFSSLGIWLLFSYPSPYVPFGLKAGYAKLLM